MLDIRILKADGKTAPRKEVVSLYASDMDYVPFLRNRTIDGDGTIHLKNPQEPVILHAKLLIPGFGFLWVTSDNCGQGYIGDQKIDFIYDAAVSRICDVKKVIEGGGFKPALKCLSLLKDAETMLALGEANPAKAPAYHMTSLAAGLWAGEMAAVARAEARIEKQGHRFMLFGAGGFSYPYDDWGSHRRGRKQILYPGMPDMKKNYDSIFNYATLPFYLAEREPVYGKPEFAYLDHLQDAFSEAGIITKGHPLWWAHPAGMPEWTKGLRYEDGSLQREIKRTITSTVEHFRGRTQYYDAINENHDWCNTYNLTQEQQPIITKYCVDCIHDVDPDAKAVINTCFMFGENAAEDCTYAGPT
ncbi:MAG: endo-1,4-beta-xylanase [Firmicutes bacterium]|nr:endo-1,4-beta-xylanase [Bacillota bacterium]